MTSGAPEARGTSLVLLPLVVSGSLRDSPPHGGAAATLPMRLGPRGVWGVRPGLGASAGAP
eukprot:475613-Pyramimonas_sp.AAC.1